MYRALNHVLPIVGRCAVPVDMVRTMVGQGLKQLITRALVSTGGVPVDTDIDSLFVQAFAYYSENLTTHSKPFPAAKQVLEHLISNGVTLGICTNKPAKLAEKLLIELDLMKHFTSLIGGDSLSVKKPDAQHLLTTIKRMGCEVKDAVMVGDSQADVEAAKRAAVPVIAVSYGYTLIPTRQLGADAISDHLQELPNILRQLQLNDD